VQYAVIISFLSTSPFVTMICFSFSASSVPIIVTPLLFTCSLFVPPVLTSKLSAPPNPNLVLVSPLCSMYVGISIRPDAVISTADKLDLLVNVLSTVKLVNLPSLNVSADVPTDPILSVCGTIFAPALNCPSS
jgi:hypothetical protein